MRRDAAVRTEFQLQPDEDAACPELRDVGADAPPPRPPAAADSISERMTAAEL
jgi:hypothetical protein